MDMNEIMKQAQAMQAKMAETQNTIYKIEIEGQAGGGMVKVSLNGKSQIRRIHIDPDFFTTCDREMLEDLITAAHNDAHNKLATHIQQETQKAMGGLPLPPGLNPFGG